MSTGYQIHDQSALYFLTFTIVDWGDVFTRKTYRDIVTESLNYCAQHKSLKIYGYVIMTNHVHLMAASSSGALSDTIRDFKKFTAYKILEAVQQEPESRRDRLLHRFAWNAASPQRNHQYQVWTHENHAVAISSQTFFKQKLDYMHQNPVRAGWVEQEEDWLDSSAGYLLGKRKISAVPLSDYYGD